MDKGDLEKGMPKRWPTLDNTRSIWYQVRVLVDNVTSHFIQIARDHIAEHHNLHHFESEAELFEFIDSLVADNMHLFPGADCLEGGVHGPNPMQRVWKSANEWKVSTLLLGRSNTGVYLLQILSSGE
jgi:hypothetical protein